MNPVIRTNRRFIKMERIARLELMGYSDEEIGYAVGITKQYVSMLRRTPEFVSIRTSVASGVLENIDSDLDESIKMSQEQLKAAVPSAVMILKNTLFNSNPKLAFEAAKEICDREGTLAKVSKSEIKEKKTFSFDVNDAIQDDLLAALQATAIKGEIEGELEFGSTPEQSAEVQEKLNASLDIENVIPISSAVN